MALLVLKGWSASCASCGARYEVQIAPGTPDLFKRAPKACHLCGNMLKTTPFYGQPDPAPTVTLDTKPTKPTRRRRRKTT